MRCSNCGAHATAGRYCTRCGAHLADQATDDHQPSPASPAGSPTEPVAAIRRRRSRLVHVGLWGVAGVMLLCVGFIVVATVPDPTALVVATLASVAPALGYGWLVLRLDRHEAEPRRLIRAAFGWGAVGAVLFSILIGVLFELMLKSAVATDAIPLLTIAVGAPLIEESFKGIVLVLALLLFRDELDNVLDGLVYGALIGLGFAMTENILYLGTAYLNSGIGGLGQLFLARVVLDGFGHASYTATTGAAIGWARQQYRRGIGRFVVPVLGWSLAVIQHFLWNAGTLLIAMMQGRETTLLSIVPIGVALFLLPALAVLLVIAHLATNREEKIIREQLADEVALGVLTPAEYAIVADSRLRRAALRTASQAGGRSLRSRQQRFFQIAAELAFRKHHLSRGERPKPGQRAPEDAYREELATLRSALPMSRLVTEGGTE